MVSRRVSLGSKFVQHFEVRSLEDIAQTPKGVPTPALITRAVHELKPFSNIEILDLGLEVKPKIDYFKIHDFDLEPSIYSLDLLNGFIHQLILQ